MKKVCVDCKAKFDFKADEVEEGDSVNCPECNLEYTVVNDAKGKPKLVETKVFEMEKDEDDEEEEPSEDFESD